MSKIYLICPVRIATDSDKMDTEEIVKDLEALGHEVYFPPRDAPQDDPTGYNIVEQELEAIKWCDEVHVYWNVNSKGSHFDLGMARALDKPVHFIGFVEPDGEGKSYVKAINKYMENRE